MNSANLLLALAILTSSFLGSWHCAGMCGAMASLMAHKRRLWSYHFGKGLSYTLIGALSGHLGSVLLNHDLRWLRLLTGLLFSFVLFYWGFQTFRGRNLKPPSWLNRSLLRPSGSGFYLGSMAIFLPCGWLYTYVLAAAATRSPLAGAITMGLFWLGGLPSLSLLPLYLKKSLALADEKKRKIGSAVLISASLYSLFSFYFL